MAENIIIKQEYFDNIKTAINGLNEFFTSGFKVKNFPSVDGDVQLESTLERIVSRLDGVDPTWMEDPNKVNDIIQTISDNLKNINPADGVYATVVNSNNETMISAIDAYVGFKMLQYIADHFQDFGKFVNGIYTFEMFTKPSQYTDVMDVFGKFIEFGEIPELDLEEKVFDEGAFVDGLMKLSQVDFPESMTIETETERLINRQDLEGVDVFVDDSVQEAAEINYFENTKPTHIKYNEKSNKWMISKQFEKTVNDLVAALRKCDTTDDLKDFFSGDFWNDVKIDPCEVVVPFILVNVMDNTKKFPYDTFNTEKYSDSYASIIKNNNGAKRFQNYDLFSTFKSDKDGTIQFIEDFLKLNLVNKEDASVNNNTLLTLFNIFDSRIYLDIMYNMLPDEKKKEKTEDEFVKEIRARINKNSKSKNAYTDTDVEDETVTEYVDRIIDEFSDASISDMMYCEQFHDSVMAEIDTVDNRIYNAGISPFVIDEYIGESYTEINEHLDDVFTEANVHKQRENLQSCVSCLMTEMERIVELDKKHQWNNNTFTDSYKTTAGMLLTPVFSNITGSTKAHTDIKQVYKYTRKALKGKSGNLTTEQKNALRKLHDLVGDLWANVKIFWVNPINWPKKMNLLRNDRKQGRVKHIADIAKRIVDMKESLDFLQDEDFVVEAWYDGSSDYIFQEATTEKNHEMLALAIKLLMKDMKSVVELIEKKQWTNNACMSKFRKRSETYTNLKQAMKYVSVGIAGAAGIPNESDKDTLKTLFEKLKEMQREIRKINFDVTKAFGANIKESNTTHKIATLAKDIVGMESDLKFVNDAPVKESSKTDNDSDDVQQEAMVTDVREFITVMEASDGNIPEYMRTRLKMSDDVGTTVTSVPLPDGVPANDLGSLTDSIDAKLDAGGELGDMLGSGFENNPNKGDHEGKIVVNITNNYNNSFNKDSGNTNTTTNTVDDHSTGKVTNTTHTNSHNNTNSHNDSSHDNRSDSSTRKSESSSSRKNYSDHSKTTNTKGSNNNNNSNGSVDTKDSRITEKDNEQKLSSGQTIQEMFMFLESKEPQSTGNDAGKPPKEDSLTKAMDRDRKLLATQQKAKKGVQKIANTGKAVLKPVTRTKQWLAGIVESLIRRDEDQVKAEIIENPSYRSMLYKATRLALHLGMIGVATAIQPYLGVALVGVEGLRLADRQRLKKEAQRELETEINIIDEKIRDLESMGTAEARKEKYKYMRKKSELESMLIQAPRSVVKHPRSVL